MESKFIKRGEKKHSSASNSFTRPSAMMDLQVNFPSANTETAPTDQLHLDFLRFLRSLLNDKHKKLPLKNHSFTEMASVQYMLSGLLHKDTITYESCLDLQSNYSFPKQIFTSVPSQL